MADLMARAMASKALEDIVYAPKDLQAQILSRAKDDIVILHDFETDVTPKAGTIEYDEENKFMGSRSLKLAANTDARVRIDLGVEGIDLNGYNLFIMGYLASEQPSSYAASPLLHLWDAELTNYKTAHAHYGGATYRSRDRWELIPIPCGDEKIPFNVRYIDLGISGDNITMNLDWFAAVRRPERGMVTFTLDGSYIGHYTGTRVLLDKYGYRAVLMQIKDQIGISGNYMNREQLCHLQSLGWDIATHSGSMGGKNLTALSEPEIEWLAKDRQAWLRKNDYNRGSRFFVALQDAWNPQALRVMEKYFWFLRNGAGGAALNNTFPVFNPKAIGSLSSYSTEEDCINALNIAAEQKQWCVFTWHQPDRKGELTLLEMESIVAKVNELGLDVVTFSDICNRLNLEGPY